MIVLGLYALPIFPSSRLSDRFVPSALNGMQEVTPGSVIFVEALDSDSDHVPKSCVSRF